LKRLDYYIDKNFVDDSLVFKYFLSTLKDSIFTWDYFVDFDKSIRNSVKIKNELDRLNTLIGLPNHELDIAFIELLKAEPNIRRALPILIAIRVNKMSSTRVIDDINTLETESKIHLFDPKVKMTASIEADLLTCFELSGLKLLFKQAIITNLNDYCLGIEVGMDTNARKNRTGTNMEDIVETILSRFCSENNYRYIAQATQSKIKSLWDIEVNVDKINRRFDFAVANSKNQLYLFEVNYYSGGGSKLKATAGEYKEVFNMLSSQNINFIWITDGLGWLTAKTALYETFLHSDYIINLEMISEGILDEILSHE
jgi:type II restriction enzyme